MTMGTTRWPRRKLKVTACVECGTEVGQAQRRGRCHRCYQRLCALLEPGECTCLVPDPVVENGECRQCRRPHFTEEYRARLMAMAS